MSIRNVFIFFICFIVILLFSGCGLFDIFSVKENPFGGSAAGKGSIQGYVFAPIGSKEGNQLLPIRQSTPPAGYEPLPEASVTVTGATKGATTDVNGYYRIDDITLGLQTVTIFKAGYEPVSFTLQVIGGQLVWAGLKDGQTNLVHKIKKWTFLVYMNADNSLDTAGIDDLNEMEEVGSTSNVNVIVQFDRFRTGTWTACRRYYVMRDNDPDEIHSIIIQELGELDMGNPQTLKDFIQWGMRTYPATHYCLVFWDHGAGWRKSSKNRGISFDDTQKTVLKVSDLKEALIVGTKFDVVVIDECLMQMAEVAYELKDYADFIAGSEEVEPQDGLPYDKVLKHLADNPDISPASFATALAQDYLAYYSGQPGLTYSVINLVNMPDLGQKVSQFAQAMKDKIGDDQVRRQIEEARRWAQSYAGYPDYRDLYDFAQRVEQEVEDAAIKSSAQELENALKNRVVLFSGTTGGTNSWGLSIYLPNPGEFLLYASQYRRLQFTVDTLWDEFLMGF